MKFKKAIAVIATTAALMLAAPTAANAAETITVQNTASSCRTLVVSFTNVSGAGPFKARYSVPSGKYQTVSTAGRFVGYTWEAGCR